MADLSTHRMTVDEFLAWAEGQDGRWELQDGAAVAMSPERVAHTETKGEAYSALKNAIAVARAPCRCAHRRRRGAHRRGNGLAGAAWSCGAASKRSPHCRPNHSQMCSRSVAQSTSR